MIVLGEITTRETTVYFSGLGRDNEPIVIPSEKYSIIGVFEHNNNKFYVTDRWYDEAKSKRLIISAQMVDSYTAQTNQN